MPLLRTYSEPWDAWRRLMHPIQACAGKPNLHFGRIRNGRGTIASPRWRDPPENFRKPLGLRSSQAGANCASDLIDCEGTLVSNTIFNQSHGIAPATARISMVKLSCWRMRYKP
jgi:hypothetical protein